MEVLTSFCARLCGCCSARNRAIKAVGYARRDLGPAAFVGAGGNMSGMGERRALRRIGDPMVAAGPAGVRIVTRLHLTGTEAAALAGIGSFLGSVYRGELAGRVRLGRLDRESHAQWRALRNRR